MMKLIVIIALIALFFLLYEVCRVIREGEWNIGFSSFIITTLSLVISIVTLYTAGNIQKQIEKYETVDSYTIGWSNSGEPRRAYTISQINNGCLENKIVFNSISDSNIGHEFNFVAARKNSGVNDGALNVWHANVIEAEKEESYIVNLYCHNNNPLGYDAVAENVHIRFEIHDPVYVKENDTEIDSYQDGYYCVAVHGYIYSSNAVPDFYSDGVKFISDKPFHLEYINGTALFENNGIGKGGGITLNDDIIADWVTIGYDGLDGRVPGCYRFGSYSSILVVPVFE